ncbi:ParA family protein [Nonomuraea helvata]|uniref:ParA family protein n=1 Tax=Nonomuraea helvata TaxID=37484 RepID=A0ABV5S5Y5_9ACTN
MSALRLAVYSEKGGVGKTSITNGLAAVAAAEGLKVLVGDLDPRATASKELGVPIRENGDTDVFTVNDLLAIELGDDDPVDPREAIGDIVHPAGEAWPENVKVLPAERKLQNREADQAPIEMRLGLGLSALADDVDLILFDMPPRAAGKLVIAGLCALGDKGGVLVPTTLTTDGLDGVAQAFRTVKLMRQGAAPDLQISGIVRSDVPKDRDLRAINREMDALLFEREDATLGPWKDYVLGDPLPVGTSNGEDDVPARYLVRHYAIREEARWARVPITAAPGREARRLVGIYRDILDHQWQQHGKGRL